MNAREFEIKLNTVIVEGLKAIDAKTMNPADMIFCLEIQKGQLCTLFVNRAVAKFQKQQQNTIIVPRPNGSSL